MNAKATALTNESTTNSKILNIALWAVQLGVAYMFVTAGFSKLSGAPQMIGFFDVIGMGQWFRYFTGALEVGGAILLVIPALAGVGGLLLAGVMTGAVATHLFLIGGDSTMAIVLFVASLFVAWGRRNRTLALIDRTRPM